ncbi:MAG: DNA primase family protein [Microthrixaceae bacterium]
MIDENDPREQEHRRQLAERAAFAEARIIAREEAQRGNVDFDATAIFDQLLEERLREMDAADAAAEVDAWAGPKPDPDSFIDKRDGLRVRTLAAAVKERLTLGRMHLHADSDAPDPLMVYRRGVWRAGGEKAIRHAVIDLLGERHRDAHARNVIDVLRADDDLTRLSADAPHPEYVNTLGGMLEWRTGELHDHEPNYRSTVQLPLRWEPNATCPTVDAWFADVLPEPGMTDFMFQVLGYMILNGNPLHRAFLLVGSGRNGKSTFLRLLEEMLGRRNCSSVPLQNLSEHRFAAAELFLKSANVCGDLAATHLRDTSTFKQLTGGDPVFAERKHRDPFRFTWWGTPIFSANTTPGADDTSHGFLARWEVIRFGVDLSGRTDDTIEERLLAELPGVLTKSVNALAELMAAGDFTRPAAVTDAKSSFTRHVDQVRGYVADWTTAGGWTERTKIFLDYRDWAERNNHHDLSAKKFYERLEAAGITPKKRSGTRGFELTLTDENEREASGAGGAGTPSPVTYTGERVEHLPYLPPPAPEQSTSPVNPDDWFA